jgi:hypothetical protein
MKKQIQKKLEKMGCRLVSTKFGIYGDWLVIGQDNSEKYFTTLGAVSRWLDK